MDREELLIEAGQRFYTGFYGLGLEESFKEAVKRSRPGNVILFSRNVESSGQLRALTEELDEVITRETGLHPLIMIDQEGGMVSRLPESEPVIPSEMALSALGDEELVRECSFRNGRLLRSLGVSVNLAPVLDVNENALNPVIGIRSFSDRPETAARLGKASIEGYKASGIISTAKHFPGHGSTSLDSHLALPLVEKGREEMEGQLLPFKAAIESGVEAVMTSHILFPGLGEGEVPCTMSRKLVKGLLRTELGFDGLVFSDSMEMKAIAEHYGVVEGSLSALEATVDIAGICHSVSLTEEAIGQCARKYLSGGFDGEEWEASLKRIREAKERLGTESALPDLSEDKAFFDKAAKRALTLVSGKVPPYQSGDLFIGPEPYITSNIADKIARESFPSYMRRAFRGSRSLIVSPDPGEEEISEAIAAARGAHTVYFGSHNAHLQTGQLRMLKALISSGSRVAHFALRNPYDLIVEGTVAQVSSYEYSERTLEALKEALEGKGCFGGSLPVRLGGSI